MLCQLSYASTISPAHAGGPAGRGIFRRTSSHYSMQNRRFPRSRKPLAQPATVSIFNRIQLAASRQNVNESPPCTQRAASAKYSVLPSVERKGRYPSASRFRTSTSASTPFGIMRR